MRRRHSTTLREGAGPRFEEAGRACRVPIIWARPHQFPLEDATITRPATRGAALLFAAAVHIARFAVIWLALLLAPVLGLSGWYQGLFANVACVVFAVALVTWLGMWRGSGALTLWRSKSAALLALPFVAEALMWAVYPGGMVNLAPGYGLWALTLLLVGVNEELTSRVAVLQSLRKAFGPVPSAVLTGALFGLQHLSQLAITDRTLDDVLGNVLLSAVYGFALAAYQLRCAWLLPLVLSHAAADFTVIMIDKEAPVVMHVVSNIVVLGYGVWLLATSRSGAAPTRAPLMSRRPRPAPPQ